MQPVGILAKVPQKKNLARGLGGGNDARGQVLLFIARPDLDLARWEGR
jgi:hypothetical protein